MIIDVHAHLGYDRVYDDDFTEQDQLDKIEQFGIDLTVLQPALVHTLEEVREQHDAIYDFAKRHPGKFLGMANPNPHLPDDVYVAEVTRCVRELGFIGVKIHTAAHGVDPSGRDGRRVFQVARDLNIPVMIHTGAGIPFANPSSILPVAREYGDVPIVLAHCGMMVMASEMLSVFQLCPNVYADITWTGGFLLKHWVSEVGAHRFLFGTDHADNCGTELAKVRTCGLSDEAQEWILSKSAMQVYNFGSLR